MDNINRLFAGTFVQRTANAGRGMFDDPLGCGVKFPQAHVETAKCLKKTECDTSGVRRQYEQRPVRKVTIAGRLLKAFSPVLQLRFNCSYMDSLAQRQRREIARIGRFFPSNPKNIGTPKAIQAKLPASCELVTGKTRFLCKVGAFELGKKVAFATLRCGGSRKVSARVMGTETYDAGKFEGRQTHVLLGRNERVEGVQVPSSNIIPLRVAFLAEGLGAACARLRSKKCAMCAFSQAKKCGTAVVYWCREINFTTPRAFSRLSRQAFTFLFSCNIPATPRAFIRKDDALRTRAGALFSGRFWTYPCGRCTYGALVGLGSISNSLRAALFSLCKS